MDTSRFPVERVSWEDAVEFCRKLSVLSAERSAGRVYRLPTEAEWEYACRAFYARRWCFGDKESKLDKYAHYGESPDSGTPLPVGSKKPNPWGLHDMHGNVWEWCQDWYDSNYYKKSPAEDPQGPSAETSHRVSRGGGWSYDARSCRSADRNRFAPSFRCHELGFRVALVILPDPPTGLHR